MKTILAVTLLVIGISLIAIAQKGEGTGNSSQPGKKAGQRIKQIRVSSADIARLPIGKSFLVDLTRRGTIYHFNPATGSIDYPRVRVRTTVGEVTLEAWLKKRLPPSIGDRWRSRRFRVGMIRDLATFNNSGSKQRPPTQAYEHEDGVCHCTGDDDCNNMFSDDVCIDGTSFCFDDDPTRPQCFCLCV